VHLRQSVEGAHEEYVSDGVVALEQDLAVEAAALVAVAQASWMHVVEVVDGETKRIYEDDPANFCDHYYL
jgi:hypothetical protein